MVNLNKKINNLTERVLSAAILAPLVFIIIQSGGVLLNSFIIFVGVVCGGEWFTLTQKKSNIWKLLGAAYIALGCYSFTWLTHNHNLGINHEVKLLGINTIISIFFLVIANDVGAYFFGKLFGGPKLCSTISPNKTWSGFAGGVICAMATTPLLGEYLPIVGFLVAVFATLGDLLESWAKRKCEIKDSSNLIPGHGGLLDRMDGMFMVAIVVFLTAVIFD